MATKERAQKDRARQTADDGPRSRFRPLPKSGLRLEARDGALLTDVFLNRIMTRGQIQTLHFGSAPRCNARLRQLYDWGYLNRTFLPTAPFGSQALYTLGKAAAPFVLDFLARSGLRAEPEDVRRQSLRPALSLLEHTLATGDLYIALRQALTAAPHVRLEHWLPERFCRYEYEVRRQEAHGTRPDGTRAGRWRGEVFQPDAFFRLVGGGGGVCRNCFLEVDRGHTSSRQFTGKLRTHARFLESGLFEEVFGWEGFQTLVVTTSVRRRDNLRALAAREGGDLFRFTTFEALDRSGFLAAIWVTPAAAEAGVLI